MPFFETADGRRLYYEQHGHTGPVLVFIHGLASASHIWRPQIRRLQQHYRLYLLDLPGHGQSDRWPHYSFALMMDVLKQWLDAMALSSVTLIAMSVGSAVALSFTVDHPNRVSKLVLEGPVGGYHHSKADPFGFLDWMVFQLFPIFLQTALILWGRNATAYWLNRFGVQGQQNARFLQKLQFQADFRAVRELLWESNNPPYVNRLNEIKIPVLLLRGAKDPMPFRFIESIHQQLAKSTLTILPNTRHIISLERPRCFNTLLREFVDQACN